MPDTYIGQEIDGFQVLEELGRGGMGVVYKAEDVALARPVALKMIARELSRDESFVRRFRSEARALARINSAYITSIYALRRTEDGIFIVMEFIGGGTLGDLMERGPVKWAVLRPVVLEMISALEHAHGVGVIHRDIKPGNILLTEDGHVKVTDFGLAKLHAADQGATVTQGIAGTLYYMSPEQVKGERNLDGRSDLYALGITIYEALSGRLPFERGGSEFSTMRKIVEDEYPLLGQFVPDLPPGVEAAVMKALAKSPDDRYPNAAAMRAAFEAIPGDAAPAPAAPPPSRREAETVVAGEAYQQPAPAKPPKPVKPAKQKPGPPKQVLLIGGGVAAFVLAALAFVLWPGAGTTPLSVFTDPPDAAVYLDGQLLGRTPLEAVAVTGDGGRLRVEQVGYAIVDTTLAFEAGEPLSVRFPLVALASTQSGAPVSVLNVTSNPSGATVLVNGARVGETPYTHRDSTAQPLTVQVERPGYQLWTQTGVVLDPDAPTEIRASLEREPATPTDTRPDTTPTDTRPAQTGTLVLRANPGGTVSAAGQSATDSGEFSVPAGSQTVRCEHPDYGPVTGTVEVRAGQTATATCYFLANVNVQASVDDRPTWGAVWVNDRYVGETGVIRLPPGTHTVEVRRDGYRSLDPSRPITIRGGLVEQTERLVFHLQKE